MDLHLRVPSVPLGALDPGSIQVLISFALGIAAIFLSAIANRFQWSPKVKSGVVILVCVLCGVLQLALQGMFDGAHALKASALILLSSQAFYNSKPIHDFAAKLERVTTPGESLRDFLQKPVLTFEIPTDARAHLGSGGAVLYPDNSYPDSRPNIPAPAYGTSGTNGAGCDAPV